MINRYDDLLPVLVANGQLVHNETNNVDTYVVPNVVAVLKPDTFPIGTRRKSYWKSAIREIVAYLRGYCHLSQFNNIGITTWDANAKNPKWWGSKVSDPHLGRIYGVQLLDWEAPNGKRVNQLDKVINNLKQGIDDRGEILMMWNPGELSDMCLRPCMYSHTFTLINGTLHMASVQRSADVPLGSNFNFIQAWFLLWFVAKITGHKQGNVTILMNNAHIYANQMEQAQIEVKRDTYPAPKFNCIFGPDAMANLQDVILNLDGDPADYFYLDNYQHGEPINYPFTTTKGA